MGNFLLTVGFLVGIWVYRDARKRGYGMGVAFLWFLGVFLLVIVFLPVWLLIRGEIGRTPKAQRGFGTCVRCDSFYTGYQSFCPGCGLNLKKAYKTGQSRQIKSWIDSKIKNSIAVVPARDFLSQFLEDVPLEINKKKAVTLANVAEKAGYGLAPDVRFHDARPEIRGSVVLFENGHGSNFRPSHAFNHVGTVLRLGVVVASTDGHVDDSKVSILEGLISGNLKLSRTEKRSLHAYLHWLLLNEPANMKGLKRRLESIGRRERSDISRALPRAALAGGVDSLEVEKLYSSLGLDAAKVSSDIHDLMSSEARTLPSDKKVAAAGGEDIPDKLGRTPDGSVETKRIFAPKAPRGFRTCAACGYPYARHEDSFCRGCGLDLKKAYKTGQSRQKSRTNSKIKSWIDSKVENSIAVVPVQDFLSQFWERPLKINNKEAVMLANVAEKAGYGLAPDVRFHDARPEIRGSVVLFENGHGSNFSPSHAFNRAGTVLRLGAMVALADGHVNDSEVSILEGLISRNSWLSRTEKRSLHAYLHWCLLNEQANMKGMKRRLESISSRGRSAIGRTLVRVALADGKVGPLEVRQLKKLYSSLGLDTAKVSRDIHDLMSSEARTLPSDKKVAAAGDEDIPDKLGRTPDGSVETKRIFAPKSPRGFRTCSACGYLYGRRKDSFCRGCGLGLKKADKTGQSRQIKSWIDSKIKNSIAVVPARDFLSQFLEDVPLKISNKEAEMLANVAEKAGYGLAPDVRFHNARPEIKGNVVLFKNGHGSNFRPSHAFNHVGTVLWLGAMVASADGHVDNSEVSILERLISGNSKLSRTEKRSLHAYLHWLLLNEQANMKGLKRRLKSIGSRGRSAIGRTLVKAALAGGVDPLEVRQLKKLYSSLGLDTAKVSRDIHDLMSSEARTLPSDKKVAVTGSGSNMPGSTFSLDHDLLKKYREETENVKAFLGSIFVDEDFSDKPKEVSSDSVETKRSPALDKKHAELYSKLAIKWSSEARTSSSDKKVAVTGSGSNMPGSTFSLDHDLLKTRREEMENVKAFLGSIFVDEDFSDKPKEVSGDSAETKGRPALDEKHAELYSKLISKWSSEARTSSSDKKVAVAADSGSNMPGSTFSLNRDLLKTYREETENVKAVLGSVFADEDVPDEAEEVSDDSVETEGRSALDEKHARLYNKLISKEQWSPEEVEAVCTELGLMVDGAIEEINDWAFENVEAPLIESGSTVCIDLEIAQELKTLTREESFYVH